MTQELARFETAHRRQDVESTSSSNLIMKNVPCSHLALLFVAALIAFLLLGAVLYCTVQKHAAWHAVAPALIKQQDRR